MKFNKYLAMCFLTSTLMCGTFTSCGDDDDNNGSEIKSSAEQGRADGKEFIQLSNEIKANPLSSESLTKGARLIALGTGYKNSDDKVYKGAFAEVLVEDYYGGTEKGDAAINTVDNIIDKLMSPVASESGSEESSEK